MRLMITTIMFLLVVLYGPPVKIMMAKVQQ